MKRLTIDLLEPWLSQYANSRGYDPKGKAMKRVRRVASVLLGNTFISQKSPPIIVAVAGAVEAHLYAQKAINRMFEPAEIADNSAAIEHHMEQQQSKELHMAARLKDTLENRSSLSQSLLWRFRRWITPSDHEVSSIFNHLDINAIGNAIAY